MDTTVPKIYFDEKGECNFCKIHDENMKNHPSGEEGDKIIKQIVKKIKSSNKNEKYDCIIGVSGGTDSSYALFIAKQYGLNPLAIHVDNGWNTDFSEKNIKTITSKLGVDLKIIKPNFNEFKDLQIAFLKASTPDLEIPTDDAITAILLKSTKENNLHYIINGQSFRTGGKCPIFWSYSDEKYIKAVHKQFGTLPIKQYYTLTTLDQLKYRYFDRISFISILDYVDYNVIKVKEKLAKELGWIPYEGKHYESIYTRFITSYILPKKFGIDKRKIHLSALIRSGQITREQAIETLNEITYPLKKIEEDKTFILNKLGLNENEFNNYINKPVKTFVDYHNEYYLKSMIMKFGLLFNLAPKKFKYYEWA
jgi:N-acetyl sugar amidotransferase